MVSKNQIKIYKLVSAVILSSVLFCAEGYSYDGNFSYFTPVEQPIQLANSILLDTSKGNPVLPKANTSIPFNLRGDFNEADYFSSAIDDTAPSPPQYEAPPQKSRHQKVPPQQILTNEITPSIIDQAFAPSSTDANYFFAPIGEPTQEETFATETPVNETPVVETPPAFSEIHTAASEDTSYSASVNVADNSPDVDLDGKRISGLQILGLNTINPDFVLSKISTQIGSPFRAEILQQDLQKIYSTGYFTDNMSVEPTLNPNGTVDLAFVLKENILVKDVSIIGNTVISTTELSPFIMPMKGMPQNLVEINSAIEKINDYYHEKGFILANVDSVEDNPDGTLDFTILEGIINRINIAGNERTKDYVIPVT